MLFGVSLTLEKRWDNYFDQTNEAQTPEESEFTLTIILLHCWMETYRRHLCSAYDICLLLLAHPLKDWGEFSGNITNSKYHAMFQNSCVFSNCSSQTYNSKVFEPELGPKSPSLEVLNIQRLVKKRYMNIPSPSWQQCQLWIILHYYRKH